MVSGLMGIVTSLRGKGMNLPPWSDFGAEPNNKCDCIHVGTSDDLKRALSVKGALPQKRV